jgi:DNA gyrase subunit B
MYQELMSRGLAGTTLSVMPPMNPDGTPGAGEPRAVTGDDLASLVKLAGELEEQLQVLEKRGINLAEFLKRRTDRQLPWWQVTLGSRTEFFHSGEEVEEFRRQEGQRQGRELVVEEAAPAGADGHVNGNGTRGMIEQELHEVWKINRNRWLEQLEERGLRVEDLLPQPRVAGREPPPRFVLTNGDQRRVLPHLRELVSEIRRLGERGIMINRFKGLGEMDPEELWDTTLDPERRTLMQVQLDDVVKADELFRTLMGEKVEPRREFIQREALNVKDIDYHGA